jgi:hypothetical protein
VLAATLAGLRCLRVTELEQNEDGRVLGHFGGEQPEESHRPVQLRCVARLISSCSGLTKLVLVTAGGDYFNMDATFLEGVVTTAAADQEEMQEQQQQGARVTEQGVPWLPQLRHLEVLGTIGRFLPTFVGGGGAPGLISFRMTPDDTEDQQDGEDFTSLAACSKLQELHLEKCDISTLASDAVPPEHLLHRSALTKLVLVRCFAEWDVLPVVSVATQLRHLDLRDTGLPDDLSSLQQLTFLDISGTGVKELPQQLGEWLPQLQVLGVEETEVAAIPQGLQRLTGLRAAHSSIPSLAAVVHLVGLQQLQLRGNTLAPPYQQLSVFTALQELSLSINEGGAQVTPSALPLLKALRLKADAPWRAAGQLVGRGRHLTSLGLYSTWLGVERAAAVGQLGVLPVLQQLVLSMPLSGVWAAGPWLLQQPQLTSLSLAWCHSPHEGREQPGRYVGWGSPSLQRLCLSRGVPQDGLPHALVHLTGLRVLRLSGPCSDQLPACVSRLTRLSVLQLLVADKHCMPAGNAAAWAVLARMPLLRRVEASGTPTERCLRQLQQAAPHLFRGVHWWDTSGMWRSL